MRGRGSASNGAGTPPGRGRTRATIRSEEPIFGLAVQGLVHPDRVFTKAGARAGDALLLSKPVGSGIVLAWPCGSSQAEMLAEALRFLRGSLLVTLRKPPPAG